MKILLAPDKFKGSLTADEACQLVTRGLLQAQQNWTVESHPVADGGEGFSDVLCSLLDGTKVHCPAHDALGRELQAYYYLAGTTAILEMANASGLHRIDQTRQDIWRSNTYGTGEIMRHAIEHSGATRIIIGIGGSATNDAGCGMAQALGARFLNAEGKTVTPTPANFHHIRSIDTRDFIAVPEILVACDVDNPLLGSRGAAAVYAPQKGAGPEELADLDHCLKQIVDLTDGAAVAKMPGAGAAGGLGFGLVKFAGAKLVSGFDLIARESGLMERFANADAIITGEGRLDKQTLYGKGPGGVARMAHKIGKPVFAIAGIVDSEAAGIFDKTFSVHNPELRSLDETITHAEQLLVEKSRELGEYLIEHFDKNIPQS